MGSFLRDLAGRVGKCSPKWKNAKSRGRISQAVGFALESLETRILFGAGAGNTGGPPSGGQGPCSSPSTGPAASTQNLGIAPIGPSPTSNGPIDYFTGTPDLTVTDLQSDALGTPWGVTRTWLGQPDTGLIGNGWLNTDTPFLLIRQNNYFEQGMLSVFQNGGNQLNFTYSGAAASGTADFNNSYTLTYTGPQTVGGIKMPGEFKLTDTLGDVTTFYDVNRDSSDSINGSGAYPLETANTHAGESDGFEYTYGGFVSYQDADGNLITANYDQNSSDAGYGQIANTIRTDSITGAQEQFAYTYTAAYGSSTTLISEIDLQRRASSSGTWATVEYEAYSYYNGVTNSADGRLGDLETATTHEIVNGVDQVTNTDYYRYDKFLTDNEENNYTPVNSPLDSPSGTGGPTPIYDPDPTNPNETAYSGLSVIVQGASYTRLLAATGSLSAIEGMSMADIAPYADNTFTYAPVAMSSLIPSSYVHETLYQVTSETVGGAGCGCAGVDGAGTYTYAYTISSFTSSTGGDLLPNI